MELLSLIFTRAKVRESDMVSGLDEEKKWK